MKMTIQKTAQMTIDIDLERKRIKKAFRKDKETETKLLELMDMIEAQEWGKALNTLNSKWWKGRDKEQECPRYEFVGMIDPDHCGDVFGSWATYIELITSIIGKPEIFKVVKVE